MSQRERQITSPRSAPQSVPTIILTTLGTLLVVIGLFVAGNMVVVGLGLGAVAVAGLLAVAERFADSRWVGSPSGEEDI